MAHKSKTQRAKASAARQARKAQAAAEREAQAAAAAAAEAESSQDSKEEKKGFFKSKASSTADAQSEKKVGTTTKNTEKSSAKSEKKKSDKPTKQHFKFIHNVKAEMKRVTWPTRQEVFRWTGVVVIALVFFGVFVAVLDNVIITPLMVLLSGIGA